MERRATPRFYVGSKARILLPDDPKREIPAQVINVSGTGLRVLISEDLSLKQPVVLDLPDHLVASEVCNRDEAGKKFAVGLQRLHEVSKLDSTGSAGEQIRGLMLHMGWLTAPEPARLETRKAAEPAAIELPVIVEPAAAAIEGPKALQPEPAAIELGESTGLAAVAMELPKAAEPKPAVIEWQVVEPAAPAIEFPKAPASEPAAIGMQAAVAAVPMIKFPPPLAVSTPKMKRWPMWVAAAAGLVLAVGAVTMVTRTQADARASEPPKMTEAPPAPATPASSTATAPISPTPQPSSIIPSTSPTPQRSAPATVAQPTNSNLHAFAITSRGPSWLEIAIDGKTVFQKMVAAGETKQMEFSRVAYVHIGNSAKVDVTLDSRPVARPAQASQLRLLELTASGARDLPWRNGAPILSSRPPGSAPQ
jgi:hypothetical protein